MERSAERHFSVEEYHRLGDANVLAEGERVELVFGLVRTMSPRNRRHIVTTTRIRELFARALDARAAVFEEKPLQLEALDSEPEPDISVYSNPDVASYGTPETEARLVIEVADSSRGYDMSVKARLYARAGIPEYWVVDLVDRRVVVFRDPRNGGFGSRAEVRPGARIAPPAWPDLELDVSQLLPEA